MLPHSYTVDSISQSQDLASTILSSSFPAQILSACAAVESFLQSHSPDQSRHFFSIAFPALICRLFGFDDAASSPKPTPSNGWIDTVLASNDPVLGSRVFNLLAPDGLLFNSIAAVDRHLLMKYVFPSERLPEWTRFMMSKEKDVRILADLCPLFKGRVKEDSGKGSSFQIQLNVFEYYMFWFAYYPVCRANSESSDYVSIKKIRKFKLENWASSIPRFSATKRGNVEQKNECNLYMRLLYAYLRAFVPIYNLNVHQPYRSSLLHYSPGYDDSVIMQAEFFVNTLIHFWLVDNDFSPVSVNVAKSFGISFPFRSVLGGTPPTPGLGDVVKLFVKYLSLSSVVLMEGFENVECSGSPRLRGSGCFDGVQSRDAISLSPHVHTIGSWNPWIQRPLYRFILRTFLFCPVGTSIKNVSQVFSVWINYMKPWTIGLDDFADLDPTMDGSPKNTGKDDVQSQACEYSSAWEGYVLSNYLYYSSLVMHFFGFAHKFLHTDVELIVQMVSKVINILTSSKELVDLIKNVDTVFHTKQAGSGKLTLNSLSRFVPSIQEQLQDWEDGLCEREADGSFLHDNWNKDLRLFGDGEDDGQQLLQLFILRAEAELQAMSGDNLAQSLQCLDSLKMQLGCLFQGHTVKPMLVSPEVRYQQPRREEIFTPRRIGNQAFTSIKYKGDWMKRPISGDEVAWLAKLLVSLSGWLNENLRLNQADSDRFGPTLSYVDVSPNTEDDVCGPTETMNTVLYVICSSVLMFGAALRKLVRKHGLRVNLRMLASKKVITLLLVYAVFSVLKKAFGALCSM